MGVVTQILPGFAKHWFHLCRRRQRGSASRGLQIIVASAVCFFASFACAQASPTASGIQQRKEGQATPVVVAPISQLARPQVPLLPSAPSDQTLPQPPEVSWDGKRLTIDAENSRLEDILLDVRRKTGASVDFPANAVSERVAVHLGPAPAREVLSSLLYGTDFDYVIQAEDNDPDALSSVVLIPRGKAGDSTASDNVVVAGEPVKTPGMRLMRGYAAPGKPAFQAAAEAALAAEQAAADGTAPAAESPAPTHAAAPAAGQGSAAGAESASAGSLPSTAAPSPADGSTVTVSDIPQTTVPTATSGGNSDDQSEVSQRMQDMMRMFQQRQQIQAQQNKAAPTPAN